MSRIGIRASTVRTWQGADIIVPNAQLVTERVTNWTLSDRTRRIDLPVGVDYGSAPEKVVEVLEAVARAHPQIMQTPVPQAVFKSFGDSAINRRAAHRRGLAPMRPCSRIRPALQLPCYKALGGGRKE